MHLLCHYFLMANQTRVWIACFIACFPHNKTRINMRHQTCLAQWQKMPIFPIHELLWFLVCLSCDIQVNGPSRDKHVTQNGSHHRCECSLIQDDSQLPPSTHTLSRITTTPLVNKPSAPLKICSQSLHATLFISFLKQTAVCHTSFWESHHKTLVPSLYKEKLYMAATSV